MSSEQKSQSQPGLDAPKAEGANQPSNPFSRFRAEPPPSYSVLLKQITTGKVKELELVPARREVIVTYPDGRTATVAILANDQQILRTAESSGTPLRVKDVRQEQALAGLAGNLALIVLIVVGLSLLLRRSAQVANKAMGFGRSQARTSPQSEVTVRFDDVAGIAEAKDELQEVVTFLKQPETFIKLGARIPRGVLLVGPPGTGKTLLAKAIAGEAGVPFFSLAASEFVELFVGVGASRVRDLFRKAKEKSPCIVFIDEIDAVGRQRGAGIGGGNDEREQTLNQLLTEMDGFADNSGVILLAATNRADVLDTALMRPGRFDRRIAVGLPDRKGREAILSVHARTRPLAEEVSLADWARRTPGFSGADLANLLNEAAILTARHQSTTLGNRELEMALERITMGLTAAPLQDGAKKRLIAYHEIGHALVAALTPHADPVDKVTLLPRSGGVGGFTRFFPDEEVLDSGLVTRAYLQARLVMALGGRAAEVVVFGASEVTQGASGDLQMVAQLAREMVTRFGFSDLGPVALEGQDQEVFLGRDLIHTRPSYGERTGREIDLRVRVLASDALQQAIQLLESRREQMDRLVDALIEEETLQSDRFYSLLGIDPPDRRPSLGQLPAWT
ncbi:MAG: ATP-dependent zinc metalloprotease FtsH [Synechococcus sp.]|uniref:ATP-dependent zinc metalloprotease FtsH n=1 Tax=Synechococcus sp. BMK-MC-1 TaxID=1442551 RepID=UPI0016479DA0|nr:ATP-dependent zinc metalloprotease FtsH [Synechococcus sp. BMK-MC-1]QNI67482.1 putative photosystem II D1 repair protein FtsH3 [Synechococcus sp. BMK-MC-1]